MYAASLRRILLGIQHKGERFINTTEYFLKFIVLIVSFSIAPNNYFSYFEKHLIPNSSVFSKNGSIFTYVNID